MSSLQSKLYQLGVAFAGITNNCYHYYRAVKTVPCIIWAESGEEMSFHSDNGKEEQRIIGNVHLFTKTEFDPLADSVQSTLASLGATWSLASVQYEDETNMIHFEWSWGITFDGADPEDNSNG